MKIAYLGNFQPPRHLKHLPPGTKPWSTEHHIALSLEALGHQVDRIQEDTDRSEPAHAIDVEREVFAFRADLFLWTRTWKIRGDALAMLDRFKAAGVVTVAYHLDLYAGLPRAREVGLGGDPWWRCDYVFTADGGSDDFWRVHGVNHIWMPPGVFHGECYRAEPDPSLICDVAFVGSRGFDPKIKDGYHPEWPYRFELTEWLAKTYGSRFRIFGDHPARWHRGESLNRLYASAKVVVGDSLVQGFKHRRYWSDRLPETLGRGGFLIFPQIGGMEDDGYLSGKHLLTYHFGDFTELKGLIDHALARPQLREQITAEGHAFVKGAKTYKHRLADALAHVAREEPRIRAKGIEPAPPVTMARIGQ